MKEITNDYFKLIEELNSKLLENDMIEILRLIKSNCSGRSIKVLL